MTHEIIKTDDYLLVVDDSEIKEGDYRMNIQRGYVKLVDDAPEYYNQRNDVFKRVIAHLPLNNSPILEGIDLLPPLEQEDDVEKMAEEEAKKLHDKGKHEDYDIYNQLVYEDKEMIKIGYNKAKEKYRWSDKDVIRIVEKSRETGLTAEYLLLSLSQPKYPIAFEQGNAVNDKTYTSVIRRTDGFTLWIGKYIY